VEVPTVLFPGGECGKSKIPWSLLLLVQASPRSLLATFHRYFSLSFSALPLRRIQCLTSISELVQSVPFLQWCPRYPSPGSVRHSPLDEIIFEESDGGVGYSAGRERAERDYGGSGSFGGGGGTSFSQWIKGATERLRGRLGRDAGGSGSADLELRDPLLPMEMT